MSSVLVFICKRISLFAASLACAVSAQASDENNFKSEELNKIRGISQAILRVRGQERQQVLAENKQTIEQIAKVKILLRQSQQKVTAPSGIFDVSPVISAESISQRASHNSSRSEFSVSDDQPQERSGWLFQARAMVDGWLDEYRDKPAVVGKLEELNSALALVSAERLRVGDELSPGWKVWDSNDPHKEKIHQRLQQLEQEISVLNSREFVSQADLQQFSERVSGAVNKQQAIDPTIYTITKHHH